LLAQAPEQLHAVHLRHAQVGDDDVGRELGRRAQRRRAVGLDADLVALVAEQLLEPVARARLVVDDDDSALLRCVGHYEDSGRGLFRASGGPSIGSTMRKIVQPGLLSTSREPPWSVTMRYEIDRPRPVPCGLVEKNASKIGASSGIPGPSSSTSSVTVCGCR